MKAIFGQSAENSQKAFDLRDRTSEIGEAVHHRSLLNDVRRTAKALKTSNWWIQTYPRTGRPRKHLVGDYC